MVWGVTSLVCVLIAGFKSFAHEIEHNKQNSSLATKTEKAQPQRLPEEKK